MSMPLFLNLELEWSLQLLFANTHTKVDVQNPRSSLQPPCCPLAQQASMVKS